jgi:pSer/pThr/pTyr-binding forkhead associated (FHA) protein
VPEPLITCIQRFLTDPKGFEARLAGRSVLLYEPPNLEVAAELGSDADPFRFRTASGVTNPSFGGGEPTIAYLEKTKDNAFQRRITLGRTGNNDIEIDAASVSRFHAWFQRDEPDQLWTVVDAGSKNGTEVGGQKLVPKKPAPLVDGSPLKVGQIELKFFTAVGFLGVLRRRSKSG